MGVRAERRRAVEADIMRIARRGLREEGPQSLSLRAIARELGMVSSGIYRYVESRDELITRLIVETFTALGDAALEAHDTADTRDVEARWDAIGNALRRWALEHPRDFALVYGTPLPDYVAPAERTVTAGTRVPLLLLRVVADAYSAGRVVELPPGLVDEGEAAVGSWVAGDDFFDQLSLPPAVIARALSAWMLLLGAVTGEVFGYNGRVPDPDALFAFQLRTARGLVLTGG